MRTTHDHHHATSAPSAESAQFSMDVDAGARSCTVRVTGELDAANAGAFADALESASRSSGQVRLDLSAVTFIDSAGIRVLVRSVLSIRQAGSALLLTGTSAQAENILRITGILDVLKEEPAP